MRKLKFKAFYQNSVIKGIFDVDIIDFKDNLITLRHKDNVNDIEMVDLDAVKLLQDTGLKDKNGQKIYEGYIVKLVLDDGDIIFGEVRYSTTTAGYIICRGRVLLRELDGAPKDIVIVGNIYDNPELLEDIKGEFDGKL